MFFNKKPKKQPKRNDDILYDANGRAIFNIVTDEWYVPFSQRKRHIIHKFLNHSSSYTGIISLDGFPVEFAEFMVNYPETTGKYWKSVTGRDPNFCDYFVWLDKIGWSTYSSSEKGKNITIDNKYTLFNLVLAGLDYERFTLFYVAMLNEADNIFSNVPEPFTVDEYVAVGTAAHARDFSRELAALREIVFSQMNTCFCM